MTVTVCGGGVLCHAGGRAYRGGRRLSATHTSKSSVCVFVVLDFDIAICRNYS